MTPSLTIDTAVLKHLLPPGVMRCKSGMWIAKVCHPIRKVWVCVGIYRTLEEANDACATKKMEYGLRTEQETTPFFQDPKKLYPGIYRRASGKWRAEIKCNKVKVPLGTYNTPEEAAFAYHMSKLELEPLSPCLAYRTSSGRWSCEIRNPLERAKNVILGTFDTAEEAEEAYNNKRREFELMFPGHKRHIESKADAIAEGRSYSTCVSSDPPVSNRDHVGTFTQEAKDAYTKMMYEFDLTARADINATVDVQSDATCVSCDPPVVITDKAEEAYNNEMCEFDLMVSADKKRKQLEDSCKADCSGESTRVSGDPPIPTRDHLDAENAYTSIMREFDLMVHVDKKRKQSNTSCEDAHNKTMNEFKMMACVDDKASCEASAIVEDRSDSTNGSSVIKEERMEFDLGVIDSHGRLIGEYSRLDDELWIS